MNHGIDRHETAARSPRRRVAARLGVIAGAAVVLLTSVTSAASAHVRVFGDGATQGGYGIIYFRVPTESPTASTTDIKVTFPSDTPVTFAETQPKAGWTITMTKANLATPLKDEDGTAITQYISGIEFKASGAAAYILPNEFETFNVLMGFPKSPAVVFTAAQTYSDGKVVAWNQRAAANAAEPEHPAPVLTLAAADSATAVTTSGSGSGSSWTGIAGLVLGAVGLLVALVALGVVLARRRLSTAPIAAAELVTATV